MKTVKNVKSQSEGTKSKPEQPGIHSDEETNITLDGKDFLLDLDLFLEHYQRFKKCMGVISYGDGISQIWGKDIDTLTV